MNDEVPDQLYVDMGKLNALYEELMKNLCGVMKISWSLLQTMRTIV